MTVWIGDARRALARVAAGTCVLFAAPAGVGGPARAQSADDGPIELDQIEVIGRMFAGWQGASDAVYDTPGSVAEIGRERIEAQGGARNAADLFRGVAGVDAVIDRQNPGLNVNIRGLQDQGRVNMSIDGARQNFQQSGHGATALVYVDPELLGGVEIDKGPTSTAGGAGVIGGVVTFRTLDFEDLATVGKDWGARVNATTGTNAFDFNGSLAAAAKVSEAFELVGAVGRKRLGEYEPGRRGRLEGLTADQKDLAQYTTQDQWSWLVKGKAEIDDRNTVKLTYTGLSTKFTTGGGVNIDTDDVKNHTVVGDWRFRPDDPNVDLAAKLYFTRTENAQFRPDRNPASPVGVDDVDVDYAIDTYGGSLANISRFALGAFDVAVTYGGEYFLDKTSTASVNADPNDDPSNSQFSGSNPVGERGVGGGFARAELAHGGWLKLIGGLRYDAYHLAGDGVVFDGLTTGCGRPRCPTPFSVATSGGRLSPTATVAVTPLPGVELYGSYEQGYRPPNLMEAVLGGEHIGGGFSFAPNPNLRPEISRTLEAGVNLKSDGVLAEGDAFRAKVSVYATTVDDFITQAVVDGPLVTPFQNVNLKGDTKFKGVDLEANYDAGYAYLGGAAAFIDAHYGDDYDNLPPFGPQLVGIYLSPKRKLTLDGGVRMLDRKLTLGARAAHVKPEQNLGTLGTGYRYVTYTLVDLYATYKIDETFTIRGSVENLRDVAYVEAMSSAISPAPGRTFTLGATARF